MADFEPTISALTVSVKRKVNTKRQYENIEIMQSMTFEPDLSMTVRENMDKVYGLLKRRVDEACEESRNGN